MAHFCVFDRVEVCFERVPGLLNIIRWDMAALGILGTGPSSYMDHNFHGWNEYLQCFGETLQSAGQLLRAVLSVQFYFLEII